MTSMYTVKMCTWTGEGFTTPMGLRHRDPWYGQAHMQDVSTVHIPSGLHLLPAVVEEPDTMDAVGYL